MQYQTILVLYSSFVCVRHHSSVMFRLASSFIQFSVSIALSYEVGEANSVRHSYTSVEERASILNYCVLYIIYSTILGLNLRWKRICILMIHFNGLFIN